MKIYYVGLDVHKATIVIAVLDANGKVVSQSIMETSTQVVRNFCKSLRGEVHVTFEEGSHAAWLYDVVKPLVKYLVVCNPKHNHLLKQGSKNDRIDARKLADLLRLKAVTFQTTRLAIAVAAIGVSSIDKGRTRVLWTSSVVERAELAIESWVPCCGRYRRGGGCAMDKEIV